MKGLLLYDITGRVWVSQVAERIKKSTRRAGDTGDAGDVGDKGDLYLIPG